VNRKLPRASTALQRQSSGLHGGPDVLSRSVDNLNLKALSQPPRSARAGSTYSAASSGTRTASGQGGATAGAPGSATKSTVRVQAAGRRKLGMALGLHALHGSTASWSACVPDLTPLPTDAQGSSSIYATPRRSSDVSSLLRPSNSRLPSYAAQHGAAPGGPARGAGAALGASSAASRGHSVGAASNPPRTTLSTSPEAGAPSAGERRMHLRVERLAEALPRLCTCDKASCFTQHTRWSSGTPLHFLHP
jgi:hypothetical protein